MSELDKLIGAVERGEPNRNDGTLFRLFGDDWVHAWDVIDRGSLDAAKALHDALLPGWRLRIDQSEIIGDPGLFAACVWPADATKRESVFRPAGTHGDPARAWLIAILCAYRQQRVSGDE